MCRCLMAIDVVSQHGPNAQGVRSRPDRSVSLPAPDARGVAAEMMGGVGNLALKRLQKQHDDLISRYERLAPDSPNAPYNQERDELLQAIDEIEEQIRKMDPPPPPPPVEVLDLDDPAARKAALAKWGAPHLGAVPDLPPGTSAMSGVEGVPGGFDFDSFDADLAKAIEGTLESAGPVTAEQSESWDLVGGGAIAIRDAVGSYVANVEGFDWEDMATVEEMADQITYDNLGETDRVDRQDHIYDRVWTEIIQAGEHAGYEYDLGEFVRFGPGGASVSEEHWPSTAEVDRQIQAVDRVAETIDRAEVTLGNIMERLGLVENPETGGSSVSEFQATPALTGLGGFQSPRIPSGLPGFQSPGSMPSGLPGFQSPGMLSDLPGFQSPGVPSGPPGFGVPSDGLLQDLVSRMGDMPLEHKLALAAALAGAGLLTVGTGGLAGPALMAGGGLSLLGNQ